MRQKISRKKPAPERGISRRGLLTSAAFVPVAALVGPQSVNAQRPAADVLDSATSETLAAFVDRIAPADASGPGAIDCGAMDYITRALGDFLAPEKAALTKALGEIDAWSMKIHGGTFRSLSADRRDAVIAAMEKNETTGIEPDGRTVFQRLRQLTVEGMFSDPYYGGNKGFAGWDLLRYPGARLAAAPDDQKLKEMPKAVRRSPYGAQYGH